MKKTVLSLGFIFLCLVLFTTSCVVENENVKKVDSTYLNKFSASELETAKKLYLEMMNTSDYSSYRIALDNFVKKINGNAIFFKNKSEYVNWISSNIDKTLFVSIEESNSIYDDMVSKYSILINKNKTLYTLLDKAETDEFLEIIEPSLGSLPTITTFSSCSGGCMDSCDGSLNNLSITMAALHTVFFSINGYVGFDAYYWTSYGNIISDFNSCMSGC